MKKGSKLLVLLLILVFVLSAAGGFLLFRSRPARTAGESPEKGEITVQGVPYAADTEKLTLKNPTEADIAALRAFPVLKEIHIAGIADSAVTEEVLALCPAGGLSYTVMINGAEYAMDTRELTLTGLTEETIRLLDLLPVLERVDAQDCADKALLTSLWYRRPELDIRYSATVAGEEYGPMTQFLELKAPKLSDLQTQLAGLPLLWEVNMLEPEGTAEELRLLLETYPQVDFLWTKTIAGVPLTNGMKEVDFSGREVSLAEAEAAMGWAPTAKTLNLTDCGISNEELAAFREEKREEYKVVWTVYITGVPTRTDASVFHSGGALMTLNNEKSQDLIYCEDMVVVDIGHSAMVDIGWVRGMPKLKYLILADNPVEDLSPLRDCKNLVYLELHINYKLRDLTPLLECTALQDLNVSECPGADLTVLGEMTWLKNLWMLNIDRHPTQFEQLRASLPDTHVESGSYANTARGWRQLQNYYDMRDLMGLPVNDW